MNTAQAELANLVPPSEDGAIGRALTELESKLLEWTDAVAAAHRSLDEQGRARDERRSNSKTHASKSKIAAEPRDEPPAEFIPDVDAEQVDAPPTENETVLRRLTEAMRHGEQLTIDPAIAAAAENVAGGEPTPQSAQADEEIEELLASVNADVAGMLRARHASDKSGRTLREVCDEYFAEVSDSEQLLASLDPEIAKAVRVQYRLFNGRKSIRQLVKEYEPPKESSKRKKSWWRG